MSSCFAFNFFRACHMIVVVVVFFFSLEVVTLMAVAAECIFYVNVSSPLHFSNGFQRSQLH